MEKVVPVVTRAAELGEQTAQSGDCVRKSGVSPQHPATKIWFGRVSNEPGHRSPPHHHEHCETGGYVLKKGHGRIYFGEDYREYVDMHEGDFVFVPPFMKHVEVNMSTTDELVWLTCRTPDNLVTNFDDVPDEQLQGYRRA